MKKNFMYAFLSAIALSGAAGFAGCSSSDEIIDNPNYNPETNRQSAGVVQAVPGNDPFRGFDNMVLIPYGSVSGGNVSGSRLTENSIILTPNGGGYANTLPAAGLAATNNSYVYQDVSIPVGTMGFLFYGKAIDGSDSSSDPVLAEPVNDNRFWNGALTVAPTGLTGQKEADPSDATSTAFTFSLVPTKNGDGVATNLKNYINAVAATTGWCNSTNTGLKGLYDKFVTMKAGSSTSVQAALEDLYESVMNNTDDVSKAIITSIKTHAGYDGTKAENKRLTLDNTVAGYPADINLPDGAIGLAWTAGATTADPATADWAASNSASASSWNTSGNYTALENYVYPASLYYRADSPVKVSTSKQSTSYSGTWTDILNLYTNGVSVGSTTQSVAIVEPIQYAVAQLKSNISIETATLKDKYGDDVKIGPTTTAGNDGTFKVTGILIGGQKDVDWQFLPSGTTTYTIYDNAIPSSNEISGTTSTVTNYTLVLDNTVPATTAVPNPTQETVYIAIEFENNAKDFMGKDGLVAKGTKFYLVGKLNPATYASDATYNPNDLIQVFKQDYVTTANFTIIENNGETGRSANYPRTGGGTPDNPYIYPGGLGAAYNVIPDLRTPLMELGLSVDLTWTTGITFDVDLGQ